MTQQLPKGFTAWYKGQIQNIKRTVGKYEFYAMMYDFASDFEGDIISEQTRRKTSVHSVYVWLAATQDHSSTLTDALEFDNFALDRSGLYGAVLDVDQACAAGTTPLWQACLRGHFQHLQPLIAKGADVNAFNYKDFRRHSDNSSLDIVVRRGSTPLGLVERYHARRSGFEEAQALLLQAGAHVAA
ncbi:hypothetical protein B9Z65_5072 [Elsinoe australis]|uniref:Uncharacterized protein n=1 Tax=Elsinoe australis TaxID=40998 RepID=A0A2P7ZD09_9PEZI|nr:hypothetical protein B9Z65_5072 [Elsinoe australis]